MKTFCDLGSIDEMMNHYNDGGGHIESSNSYDEVANFNTIANAQTDMIFHYDEVASFGSMPINQKDFFPFTILSLFQNYYFLTFDFEIRGCVMFSKTS